MGFFKQVDRLEKRKLVLVYSYRIYMQLIEGQVCVRFFFYKKTDR